MEDTGEAELVLAASDGDLSSVTQMLDALGFSVDALDDDGSTPLMAACFGGHADLVELLLERGADVNLQHHV